MVRIYYCKKPAINQRVIDCLFTGQDEALLAPYPVDISGSPDRLQRVVLEPDHGPVPKLPRPHRRVDAPGPHAQGRPATFSSRSTGQRLHWKGVAPLSQLLLLAQQQLELEICQVGISWPITAGKSNFQEWRQKLKYWSLFSLVSHDHAHFFHHSLIITTENRVFFTRYLSR